MKDKPKRTKLPNIDVDYKPKSRVGDVVRWIWNNQHSDDQNLDVEPLPSPYKVGVCPHFNICGADTFNEPLTNFELSGTKSSKKQQITDRTNQEKSEKV